MISDAEKKYYLYITQFFTGCGAIVELGPWLGLSTKILVDGLSNNPNFSDRKIYVFDDFTWRASWMDKWFPIEKDEKPVNHGSFEYLFRKNLESLSNKLIVKRRKIVNYEGNEALREIGWEEGLIELIVVDCGRPFEVNEAWWKVFSPFFIKDRTLVIMQDWQNHKSVPEQHWENTKLFTDKKEGALELVHEVLGGGLAMFIYRG
jgi:hypothetical protein